MLISFSLTINVFFFFLECKYKSLRAYIGQLILNNPKNRLLKTILPSILVFLLLSLNF